MLEEDSDLLRDGDEASVRGDRLGEGAGPDIDLAGGDAEVLVRAAAGSAQDSGGMRFINHEETTKFFFERNQLRQAADVAIHRENPVGDDERAVGGVGLLELIAQGLRVVVAEALQLDAGHAARVEETAMAKLIHDDPVGGAEQTVDDAEIRQVAGTKGERVFRALEPGEGLFHLAMNVERSGEQTGAAGAGAVAPDGFHGGGVDAWVADQPKVVVRRHHEHLVTVRGDARAGLCLERHVVRVGIEGAGEGCVLKDAASPWIEQVGLLEVPGPARGKVVPKHLAGGRGESCRGLRVLFDVSKCGHRRRLILDEARDVWKGAL